MDQPHLLDKLKRLMPPPAPAKGWGLVRLMAASWVLGPQADTRQASAEANLRLGSKNSRVDAAPTDWTSDPHTWLFKAGADAPGAAGFYLDDWGRGLGVPRETGEPDGLYSPRILAELLRPTTTNTGLAQAIDQGMGIVGTEVIEAESVLKVYRLDSPVFRLDSPGKRWDMAGDLGGNTLSACFIVRVPTGAQQPYNESTIRRLADRRKAAGTRLIGIYTATGGAILAPDFVTVGQVATAYIQPITGATYAWSVTGGVIDTGQGTNQITFHANAPGPMGLSVLVTLPAGGTNYWKPVTAYAAMNTAIDTGLYQFAGTFRAVAAITNPGPGYTIEWSGTGIGIEGPIDGPIVTYDVGMAGTLGTLKVKLKVASGATGESTVYIKSVPYTSSIAYTTAVLAPKALEQFALDLGWEYDILSVQTNVPARIRVYNTAATRAADLGRAVGIDPGVAVAPTIVIEAITTIGGLIVTTPITQHIGVNGDTPRTKAAYLIVENTDPLASVAITVTLNRTETRTSGVF